MKPGQDGEAERGRRSGDRQVACAAVAAHQVEDLFGGACGFKKSPFSQRENRRGVVEAVPCHTDHQMLLPELATLAQGLVRRGDVSFAVLNIDHGQPELFCNPPGPQVPICWIEDRQVASVKSVVR